MPYKDKETRNKRWRELHAKTDRQKGISHPEKYKYPNKERDSYYKKNYGISLDEYNEMFNNQSGCCAICGKHQVEFNKRLSVDHDHETNKIRKLLCQKCNAGLGTYDDDIELLLKAVEYLRGFK